MPIPSPKRGVSVPKENMIFLHHCRNIQLQTFSGWRYCTVEKIHLLLYGGNQLCNGSDARFGGMRSGRHGER
jgi:hypothetical protein